MTLAPSDPLDDLDRSLSLVEAEDVEDLRIGGKELGRVGIEAKVALQAGKLLLFVEAE